MPSSRVRSITDSSSVLMTPSTEMPSATNSSTCTMTRATSNCCWLVPTNSSLVCTLTSGLFFSTPSIAVFASCDADAVASP